MDPNYNPQEIEAKWQVRWKDAKLFESEADSTRPKYYVLEMLPYPSGDIHMGHVRNYSIGDALARFMAMKGFNILHPIGWDAFGLPAENAAIKHQRHPSEFTFSYIERMREQLKRLGSATTGGAKLPPACRNTIAGTSGSFSRCMSAAWPTARRAAVNWCPLCETVLANEQVVDGCCWRHEDTPVDRARTRAVVLKTTAYAEQLLDDMKELVRWPERVLAMQQNWIGKSTGRISGLSVAELASRCASSPRAWTRSSAAARSSWRQSIRSWRN